MSVPEFLKDLPCYNEQNFALFNSENGIRTSSKRPSVYLPTVEIPSEQIIVPDKKQLLLRYLHQQWDKKCIPRKREHGGNENPDTNSRKRARLEVVNPI